MSFALVKYVTDGERATVPIRFFKDVFRGSQEAADLELGEIYPVFWSPEREETPSDVEEDGSNVILDIDELDEVEKNRLKKHGQLKGFYNALLLSFTESDSFEKEYKRELSSSNCLGSDVKRVKAPSDKALEAALNQAKAATPKTSKASKNKSLKQAATEATKRNLTSLFKECDAKKHELDADYWKTLYLKSLSKNENSKESRGNGKKSQREKDSSKEKSETTQEKIIGKSKGGRGEQEKSQGHQEEREKSKGGHKKKSDSSQVKKMDKQEKMIEKVEGMQGKMKDTSGGGRQEKEKKPEPEQGKKKEESGQKRDRGKEKCESEEGCNYFETILNTEESGTSTSMNHGKKSGPKEKADGEEKQKEPADAEWQKLVAGTTDSSSDDDEEPLTKGCKAIPRGKAGDSLAVYQLANKLWDPQTIIARSPSGLAASSKQQKKGYPMLSPSKVKECEELVRRRVLEENEKATQDEVDVRVASTHYILGQKIGSVRKTFRRRGLPIPTPEEAHITRKKARKEKKDANSSK